MESKMNCKQYFRAVQKILFLFFGLFFLWTLCDLWINQDSKALVNLEHSKTIKGRAPAESEGSVDRRNHSTPCGGLNPYDTELKEDYRTQNLPSDINCPDSLRYTASRVNWLKERFLDNITIFLKKDHFSEKEWRRLEKFVPPYGWKEVNYSVIKQVAAHLPEPIGQWIYTRVSGAGCITCAVVGNGGILNGSNIGQEIDSHDYIFRGNGAVIQGFEKDVGRRTSFYGFTKFTLWDCLTKLKEIGFTRIPGDQDTLYIELPEAAEDYGWLNHLLTNKSVGFGGTDSHNMQDIFKEKLEKLLVIHPDFMRYIRSRFLKSEILKGLRWCQYRPSIGAVLLMTALHMCDKVDVYGFMTDNFHQFSGYYYELVNKPLTFSKDHDFFLERDLWEQLDSMGFIRLQRRD